MIIDCIADLHGFFPKLEGGDLLIVAGDLTARDEEKQYLEFEAWLEVQDYRRKIVIAGNHDNFLVKYGHNLFCSTEQGQDQYLCDSGTEFESLKIWGSPWTKTFPGMNPHCKAFTCDTEEQLWDKWDKIPHDTDILITHSPAHGVLDKICRKIILPDKRKTFFIEMNGSYSLADKMAKLRPKLHIFGHIHEEGGKEIQYGTNTICINCSHVNEQYQPVNKPIRIIL